MQRRSATTIVLGTLAVALLALVVAAGVWRADGGRWYDVRTASMGTAAPVGTLLLTRPTTVAEVGRGDLITFRAPGSGKVYTHRVVDKTAAGITTRGDVNPAADAWTLHQRDLVGRVAWSVPGLGWLLRGLPLLLLSGAVVWLLSALAGPRLRASVRVVGASLTLAVVGLVLHPWVALERIGMTRAHDGVVLRLVSTGLLPVRASAARGTDSVRLTDGAVGRVHVPHKDANGFYSILASLDLSLLWWVAIVLVCAAPLLWCLLFGLAPVEHTSEPLPEPVSEEADGGAGLDLLDGLGATGGPGRHRSAEPARHRRVAAPRRADDQLPVGAGR